MSGTTPQQPTEGPEYLGSGEPTSRTAAGGSGRKWGALGGAAVAVAAVVGMGGWGAYALLSGGGSQPAEAIPANAIGYLSIDLDPSASQKIEALSILRKFPGIEQELDISDRDDLRRYVFEKIQDEGTCTDLDYDRDVQPWIGDRIAFAAIPEGQNEVVPLVAVQVSDRDAAAAGIDALARCGSRGRGAGAEEPGLGYAFSGDYALLAETDKQARSFADATTQGALADDDAFNERMASAGDPGIVTMYASADAPGHLFDMMNTLDQGIAEPLVVADAAQVQDAAVAAPAAGSPPDPMSEQMKKLYENFDGAAGVVRFEDGAVELEYAAAGMPTGLPGTVAGAGTAITELPASTGAAFSLALPDAWLADYLEQLSVAMGEGVNLEDMLAQMEAETGLELPEDIETLLGESVTVAYDAENDMQALERSEDGHELLAGVRVQGDPDEITSVVDKIKARLGPAAEGLHVEEGDDVVAFGLNRGYVDALTGDGSLGEDAAFQDVVPNAESAGAVLFVNFDAGDGWMSEVAEASGDEDLQENLEPLDALGISAWDDDDVEHSLFRLTTD